MPILEKFERDNLFQTDFMKSLTNEYWMVYLKKIILRTLIPWVIYSALSLVYFAHTLSEDFESADEAVPVKWQLVGVILLILIIYLLFIEAKQVKKDKKGYLLSLYNYIDLFQYLGTTWVILNNMTALDAIGMSAKRNLCMFVLISQGMKAIADWLRLFDGTSFYVTLILSTFVDIAYFLLITLILLIYIGNAMYMLQLNADHSLEDSDIIEPALGN